MTSLQARALPSGSDLPRVSGGRSRGRDRGGDAGCSRPSRSRRRRARAGRNRAHPNTHSYRPRRSCHLAPFPLLDGLPRTRAYRAEGGEGGPSTDQGHEERAPGRPRGRENGTPAGAGEVGGTIPAFSSARAKTRLAARVRKAFSPAAYYGAVFSSCISPISAAWAFSTFRARSRSACRRRYGSARWASTRAPA